MTIILSIPSVSSTSATHDSAVDNNSHTTSVDKNMRLSMWSAKSLLAKRSLSIFPESMHSKILQRIERIRQNHTNATIAFCMCIFAHTYLSNSLFPYAGFMAIRLLDVTEETAGTPGGFLCSSFLMGRALSSYHWGKLADIYGRKFAIILSFGLCSIFSLFFGFSKTWVWAIISRFLCGICGGITGVMTTALSEISHEDADLETKGFGLFAGRWSWGLLIAPGIGGMLAEPFEQYPILLRIIHKDSMVYKSLTSVPFALPNILGALLCWTSMVGVSLACDETLSRSSLREPNKFFFQDCAHYAWITLCSLVKLFKWVTMSILSHLSNSGYTELDDERVEGISHSSPPRNHMIPDTPTESLDGLDTQYGTNAEDSLAQEEMEILSYIDFPGLLQLRNKENVDAIRASFLLDSRHLVAVGQEEETKELLPSIDQHVNNMKTRQTSMIRDDPLDPATITSIWANKPCRKHLLVFWIYGFVSVLVDGAFPLYCMSISGGLGISEARVGAILSLAGTIINFCQFTVYMFVLNRLGLQRSMILGSFVSVVLLAFIPLSIPLNESRKTSSERQQLTSAAFVFLVTVLAASRVFSSSVEASLLVSMQRTVLPSHRSTMNALCALFASLGRAFGPLFAGSLVEHCFSFFPPPIGGFIIWIVLALSGVASCTVFMTLLNNNVDDSFTQNRHNLEAQKR